MLVRCTLEAAELLARQAAAEETKIKESGKEAAFV